jgi:hypothetical protein
MVDISYNYLSGVNCGEFTDNSLSIVSGTEEKWKWTINKEDYIDPDSRCKKLYEDLSLYYNGLKLPNGNYIESVKIKERNKGRKNCFYELIINILKEEKETKTIIAQIGLGVDYIGPSIYWACEAGMTSREIGTFLQTTRTIGGHIVWPRWIGTPNKNGQTGYEFIEDFKSINVSRGGEKGFYDRIDLTLFDLKEWYLERMCKLQFTYDKNKIWLEQFVDFKNFINFFKLDCFVCVEEEEYKIKNLCSLYRGEKSKHLSSNDVDPASIPKDRIAYSKFADASVDLTKLRNALLNKQ